MIDFACKRFDLKEIIKCSMMLTKADMRVLEYVQRTRNDIAADVIANALKLDLSTVQRSVKKLHEKNLIQRMQKNLDGGGYVFCYRTQDKKVIRKLILDIVHGWTKRVEDELEGW